MSVSDIAAEPLPASPVAAAALRELPEALIVVFDQELRFVRAAGRVLERTGDPRTFSDGQFVGDAFPIDNWTLIAPLFRSALEGETRSREIWSEGQRYCLKIDVGPLRVQEAGPEPGARRPLAGGVAMVLDVTARRRADAFAVRPLDQFEQAVERAP